MLLCGTVNRSFALEIVVEAPSCYFISSFVGLFSTDVLELLQDCINVMQKSSKHNMMRQQGREKRRRAKICQCNNATRDLLSQVGRVKSMVHQRNQGTRRR